jgi:hydrogenase maturation protease
MRHQQKNKYDDRILVMGIGNYLMGDEGVGVHFAKRMAELSLPFNIDVVDGGTGGFHLLEYFESYPKIILVDATMDTYPVGTVRLIKPRFAADFPKAMSTHDIGLKDMVSALQIMGKTPEIHLFVVSIESLQQQGIALTEEIEAIMPWLTDLVLEEIEKISNIAEVLV